MKKLNFVLIISIFTLAAAAQSNFSNPTFFVGSVVEDLDKSVDFYTKVIGMESTATFSVDGTKAKELGLTDGRKLDVSVLKLENSPQANEWKLMSCGTKADRPKPKYIHDGMGMRYITILVNHLNPIIERIEKNDVPILSRKPSDLGEGKYFILVQDPDGTFIELIGPK